jgi:hypothetical protein
MSSTWHGLTPVRVLSCSYQQTMSLAPTLAHAAAVPGNRDVFDRRPSNPMPFDMAVAFGAGDLAMIEPLSQVCKSTSRTQNAYFLLP